MYHVDECTAKIHIGNMLFGRDIGNDESWTIDLTSHMHEHTYPRATGSRHTHTHTWAMRDKENGTNRKGYLFFVMFDRQCRRCCCCFRHFGGLSTVPTCTIPSSEISSFVSFSWHFFLDSLSLVTLACTHSHAHTSETRCVVSWLCVRVAVKR